MKKVVVLFFVLTSLFLTQGYASQNEMGNNSFVLFAGNSNPDLALEVANILGVDINEAEVGKFNDGEISININDPVKGKDVYILQSICSTKKASVNDNLMELYLLIRACKRSSANSNSRKIFALYEKNAFFNFLFVNIFENQKIP